MFYLRFVYIQETIYRQPPSIPSCPFWLLGVHNHLLVLTWTFPIILCIRLATLFFAEL